MQAIRRLWNIYYVVCQQRMFTSQDNRSHYAMVRKCSAYDSIKLNTGFDIIPVCISELHVLSFLHSSQVQFLGISP